MTKNLKIGTLCEVRHPKLPEGQQARIVGVDAETACVSVPSQAIHDYYGVVVHELYWVPVEHITSLTPQFVRGRVDWRRIPETRRPIE